MSDEPFKLRRRRSRRAGKHAPKASNLVGMVFILVIFSALGLVALFYSHTASRSAPVPDPAVAPAIEWNIVEPSQSTEQAQD